MAMLIAATAAFLATHLVSSTPLRPALIQAMGEWPYRGLYSLVAFITLGWMIWAYAQAPRELLWSGWRLLPLAGMPVAFILLACGLAGNPTAVGGEAILRSEQPARGIVRITRHPVMWAIMIWSLAHLLARGDAKSTVFFGGFLALAALGTWSIDARKKSDPAWPRLAGATSNIPFVAIAQGRNRMAWQEIGLLRPALGLVLFAVFFAAHPWLFGARPY
jgi:uncharacterized membrane protein